MNSPAPGWLPDPTGRHEHRYWDGFNWTSDVSDGGVTSFDPYEAAAPQPMQQPQQPLGYGPQGYSSGPYGAPPAGGGGSGPSTGLLMGLGAAILVVIVAIVFVVASGGDDDGDPIATTDDTSDDSGDGTTDTTDDDTTDTTDDDSGGGDLSESDQVIVDSISSALVSAYDGVITEEDADCIAEAMFTEIGFDRLAEMGANADPSDPLGGYTSEEVAEMMDLMLTCVDAETLIEMGYEQPGN